MKKNQQKSQIPKQKRPVTEADARKYVRKLIDGSEPEMRRKLLDMIEGHSGGRAGSSVRAIPASAIRTGHETYLSGDDISEDDVRALEDLSPVRERTRRLRSCDLKAPDDSELTSLIVQEPELFPGPWNVIPMLCELAFYFAIWAGENCWPTTFDFEDVSIWYIEKLYNTKQYPHVATTFTQWRDRIMRFRISQALGQLPPAHKARLWYRALIDKAAMEKEQVKRCQLKRPSLSAQDISIMTTTDRAKSGTGKRVSRVNVKRQIIRRHKVIGPIMF